MKIALIAAMGKELDLILTQMPGYKCVEEKGNKFYEGRIGDHEILAAQCGIGKVNSALRTQTIIETFKPDLVINSGVAGGVDISMHIGDTLVADKVAYHDVWCGPGTIEGQADGCPLYLQPWAEGLELLAKSDISCKKGLLCSGDRFISSPLEVQEIKRKFPEALGCDMESASIAQTCHINGVPFMIIRVMSDMPGGGENIAEYCDFWSVAPQKTFNALTEFLKLLN